MADAKPTLDYDKFDPELFLKKYYSTTEGDKLETQFLRFRLDAVADICSTGQLKGKRCLDIGSGPCLHSIISIAEHVDEIHLSDFARKNVQVLKDWKYNFKEIQRNIFQYILDKTGQRKLVDDFVSEIRSKVTSIELVDFRKNPIFPECKDAMYDVVIASLCLEAAAESIDGYEDILNNITKVLKINGYLVLVGVLEESFYVVGNQRFHVLPLTKEKIMEIYRKHGYQIETFKLNSDNEKTNDFSDFKGFYVMLAKKLGNM